MADSGKGEASVASPALEAWIARRLTCFDATVERLEGAVKPQDDILQDVSVNLTERWTRRFESGQFGFLLVVTSPNVLSAFPPDFALFRGDTVERATYKVTSRAFSCSGVGSSRYL